MGLVFADKTGFARSMDSGVEICPMSLQSLHSLSEVVLYFCDSISDSFAKSGSTCSNDHLPAKKLVSWNSKRRDVFEGDMVKRILLGR